MSHNVPVFLSVSPLNILLYSRLKMYLTELRMFIRYYCEVLCLAKKPYEGREKNGGWVLFLFL